MARSFAVSVAPSFVVLLALSLLRPPTTIAADGNPVCNVPGDLDSPSLTTATDLATWIAWRDLRRTVPSQQSDVYVARLPAATFPAPAGEVGFASRPGPALHADGILACQSGTAGPPVAVATDSGGVLVLFADTRFVGRGVYAVRLRPDGSLYPGWPVDGRLVAGDVFDLSLAACSDGAGGAYVARKRSPTSASENVTVTRMTKDGAIASGWTAGGVVIGSDEIVQGFTLEADPSGGAVFTVRLYFNGASADLQYARGGRVSPLGVLASSAVLPGWRSQGFAAGVVASLAIADGNGGLFAAWNDAPAPEFYAQHWGDVGGPQWPDSLPGPHMDALVRDGEGGVYLVGRVKQDLNHLAVQRRDAGGGVHTGWNASGFAVADPQALAHVTAVRWASALGNGGVLVVWSEIRGGSGTGFDVRALHVRKDARLDPHWPGGGLAVCDVAGNQTTVVASERGVIAWIDSRNAGTTGTDLWASQVTEPGLVGVPPITGPARATRLAIRSVFPNPATYGVRVTLALAAGEPLRVDLVDLRGRVVRSHGVTPGGEEARVEVSTRGLPAGLYWVRAVQGEVATSARVTVLN